MRRSRTKAATDMPCTLRKYPFNVAAPTPKRRARARTSWGSAGARSTSSRTARTMPICAGVRNVGGRAAEKSRVNRSDRSPMRPILQRAASKRSAAVPMRSIASFSAQSPENTTVVSGPPTHASSGIPVSASAAKEGSRSTRVLTNSSTPR